MSTEQWNCEFCEIEENQNGTLVLDGDWSKDNYQFKEIQNRRGQVYIHIIPIYFKDRGLGWWIPTNKGKDPMGMSVNFFKHPPLLVQEMHAAVLKARRKKRGLKP